eukprot:CAMPEP_0114648196 /NCGR_PEP_ID=MMETSP0191-20121206/6254_1 /TAXON_ID=126664 /ORGANISM="Sorites sp." /LENGTH=89 /DNA_ID=CAMNT_0001861473 /DNA_START=278 /DNA_END=544 /DNA_ORIENTATION=+
MSSKVESGDPETAEGGGRGGGSCSDGSNSRWIPSGLHVLTFDSGQLHEADISRGSSGPLGFSGRLQLRLISHMWPLPAGAIKAMRRPSL